MNAFITFTLLLCFTFATATATQIRLASCDSTEVYPSEILINSDSTTPVVSITYSLCDAAASLNLSNITHIMLTLIDHIPDINDSQNFISLTKSTEICTKPFNASTCFTQLQTGNCITGSYELTSVEPVEYTRASAAMLGEHNRHWISVCEKSLDSQ